MSVRSAYLALAAACAVFWVLAIHTIRQVTG